VQSRNLTRAVLFDLDDTLFDHEQAARSALSRVHESHTALAGWPFDDFAAAHGRVLETLHLDVLAGTRSIDSAREERFRRLFAEAGADDDPSRVEATAALYRAAYIDARRPVDGARALLEWLKPRVRIGIVTNNLLEEQRAKVRHCGFESLIDALVVSEAVGVSKPDPAIFRRALEQVDAAPADAVMVGDSWPADVEGARGAGIRAIWFNRRRRVAPVRYDDVLEVDSLVPMTAIVHAIFPAHETELTCASA
jgi:putative hydrolase of the HAD superfamily